MSAAIKVIGFLITLTFPPSEMNLSAVVGTIADHLTLRLS
jgi:hypothetical protein